MGSDDQFDDGMAVGRGASSHAAPVKSRSVAFGYGSGAEDASSTRLDLNEALIRNPQATFIMRAAGTAMVGAGIDDGDTLLVDRAVAAAHGHLVIAVVDAEMLCRRFWNKGAKARLVAADPEVASVAISPDTPLEIWGVVTTIIKRLPV
jgi:DNA polymerase V